MSAHQCNVEESCATQPSTVEHCDMPEKLLNLADEAWYEVLKDKIKGEIIKSSGKHMDDLAKLVADANKDKWVHMITGKVKCEEYKQNLKALMTAAAK